MHVWRERLGRWFDAPARRCPFSPNAITLVALLINLSAAGAFAGGSRRPWLFLLGIGLLAVGGLADAFDGIVARVQNKSTRFGDFLDHVADRISDTAVALGWLVGSGVSAALTLGAVTAVVLNGYVGTQIEATWGQRNYDSVGRGEFVLALVVFPLISYILVVSGWAGLRIAGLSIPDWLAGVLIAFALLGIIQRMAQAGRLERER